MSNTINVALAQINAEVAQPVENLKKFQHYAAQAKANKAQVVIFPEMSDTGYVTSQIPQSSNPWPGLAFDAASKAAKDNAIFLICGLSEKTTDNLYNSLACFNPQGQLCASYRKTT